MVYGRPHPFIGDGYLGELKAYAASLKLEERVFFLDRHLSSEELHRLNEAADVAVFAHLDGRQRSSGTMLLAMAAGAVPVATPFAQAEELLRSGAGVLVPFKSADAIATAVVRLALNATALDDARLRAYRAMRGQAWPAVAAQYLSLAEQRLRARARHGDGGAPDSDGHNPGESGAESPPGVSPAGFYTGEESIRFADTTNYASVDNGVIAIEASRPNPGGREAWASFKTGIHFRRSERLGRSDFFALGGTSGLRGVSFLLEVLGVS